MNLSKYDLILHIIINIFKRDNNTNKYKLDKVVCIFI